MNDDYHKSTSYKNHNQNPYSFQQSLLEEQKKKRIEDSIFRNNDERFNDYEFSDDESRLGISALDRSRLINTPINHSR